MLFIIEHLEPELSEWLYMEYSHAAQIVGRDRLLITNVKKPAESRKLREIALVERKRVGELFAQKDLVLLDPGAGKILKHGDLTDKKAVVIGGILGEDPPLRRTEELLTRYMPKALTRNIGEHQFAIDGAIYVAKQASDGKPLSKLPVRNGLEIKIGRGHSVILPYAYPLVNGKPLISGKIIKYLKRPWKLGSG